MEDQLNVPLEDSDLLAEVELMTALIIAASSTDGPLSQHDIDELLEVPAPRIPEQQVRDLNRED
jgi:hypothetical protein